MLQLQPILESLAFVAGAASVVLWLRLVPSHAKKHEPNAVDRHGVTEAALKHQFHKARKPATAPRKRVPMLQVRVDDEARLFSVEMGGSVGRVSLRVATRRTSAAVIANVR